MKSQRFTPIFYAKNCIVLALTFRSMIYFNFVYGVKYKSNFILLHVDTQLFQHNLLKSLLIPHWMVLTPLSKIGHKGKGLSLDSSFYPIDLYI